MRFSIILVLTLLFCSCNYDLKIIEDKNYVTEPYRFTSNGRKGVYLYRRFFVKNYRHNKIEFDIEVQKILCSAVNDSMKLTYFGIIFTEGASEWDLKGGIVAYDWRISEPEQIEEYKYIDGIMSGNMIPFNCVFD